MQTIKTFTAGDHRWINRPAVVEQQADRLVVTTDANTDFWLKTYYGFSRHSGHACGYAVNGDFTLQVKIRADFRQLYDQAGIFIRDDEQHWVKAGIEFNDGAPAIGCVVTREFSDWSTGIFPGDARQFWMRVTLKDEALRIQYSCDGVSWPLLRLAPWSGNAARFVGVMCCSPERQGLEVEFSELQLGDPLQKSLHDLS